METLRICRTAHEGTVAEGTKVDHGELDAGRLVPVPPTLSSMLNAQVESNPARDLLFYEPDWKDVAPRRFLPERLATARDRSGMDIRMHERRHSYITLLRRSAIDDGELAEIAGHQVATMLARYTHTVGTSFENVRRAIGSAGSPLLMQAIRELIS